MQDFWSLGLGHWSFQTGLPTPKPSRDDALAPLRRFESGAATGSGRRAGSGRGSQRQRDGEGCAASELALDVDRTAMGFHDRLADRQAQTGARRPAFAAADLIGAEKPLEDVGQVLGRDAD